MKSFGQQVIDFTQSLRVPEVVLPPGFEWLFPYENPETMAALTAFYQKFYADSEPRIFLFGINPGRFGAGITGVPFTDPLRLETECGIENSFAKKQELSSDFVWRFINSFGKAAFFSRFYITSILPLGFVKGGKNINYYDDRQLERAVEPFAAWNLTTQLAFGSHRHRAICMGEGQNFRFFRKLNEKHGFFERIDPLPHPRWVMQYRRKSLDFFVEKYVETVGGGLLANTDESAG